VGRSDVDNGGLGGREAEAFLLKLMSARFRSSQGSVALGERHLQICHSSLKFRLLSPPPMGLESTCILRIGRTRHAGKALLETDYLLFRGDEYRLKIPFTTITELEASKDSLSVTHASGVAVFELGAPSAKWAERIRNPRSLIDKLGVKEGMQVAVLGVDDADFMTSLRSRTDKIATKAAKAGSDLIFYAAESPKELSALASLKAKLQPNGAIWVVHRKGKGATLKDVEVFAAARAAGLVDNKVASFSATHTAEKLVIPVAAREAPK
jgi:hypothetical protein